MPYCIYLRKSRTDAEAEARGEGETLARHQSTLLDMAQKMSLPIDAVYREVVSGETLAARPVMQRLLSEVGKGIWDGVLVMEIERLARGDTIDQGIVAQTFKFSKTKIITPLKTYDPHNEFDEEYFEFGLFMSRREYKTINRRLQRGRLASVKEGKYAGSIPPYGYNRQKLVSEKGYTLAPHPDEANTVRLIYDLYIHGLTQADGSIRRLGAGLIARYLNKLQIPAPKGKQWAATSIRDILSNPVYIGKIRWNQRQSIKTLIDGQVKTSRPRSRKEDSLIVDGLHKPIIRPETYHMAQEYLAKNPPQPVGQNKTVQNPLRGLLICAKCGRRMIRRPYQKNGSVTATVMCPAADCENISVSLPVVETRILATLALWMAEYQIKRSADNIASPHLQTDFFETNIQKANKELIALRKQAGTLYDLLEQGVYTAETFESRSKIVTEKIECVQKQLDLLTQAWDNETKEHPAARAIPPQLENVSDLYYALPTAKAKNDMLKTVLEKVIYCKEKKGRWHTQPDDFCLTLFPRLPKNSP